MPVASPPLRAARTRDRPRASLDTGQTKGSPAGFLRGQHRHSQPTSTATSTANTTSVRTGIIGSRSHLGLGSFNMFHTLAASRRASGNC